MATKEEMKAFLTKRGYDVKVEVDQTGKAENDTYIIECKKSDESKILDTLRHISQPGRFIINTRKPEKPWWKVWQK